MARKKDTPCAACGALIWRPTRHQPPVGEAMCRNCRGTSRVEAPEHGTRVMYRERGCRCDQCRSFMAAQVREYNSHRRATTGLSYWQARRPAATRRSPGRCSKCGAAIQTVLEDPLCALCRGNRPGYNIRISQENRLAIYERDGWVCQLCDEPVDRTIDPRTRWGATLDHILPRSHGGGDAPENLRLAHRRCNAVRGNPLPMSVAVRSPKSTALILALSAH